MEAHVAMRDYLDHGRIRAQLNRLGADLEHQQRQLRTLKLVLNVSDRPNGNHSQQTIAEAIRVALADGPLHARDILRRILESGKKVGGKQPISVLVSTMRRDAKIKRVEGKKNTWELA